MMIRLFALVLCFLTGCNAAATEAPVIPPTPTTLRMVQTTAVPTVERRMQAVATPLPGESVAAVTETPEPLPGCEGTEPLPGASHMR